MIKSISSEQIEWSIKRIGELGNFYGGSTPSTVEPNYWDGDICFLVPSDISNLDKHKIYISDTKSKITQAGLMSCSTVLLKPGTVCVSSRATIGDCVISEVEICTNQGFINVACNELLVNVYLVYWILQNKNQLLKYSAGTTFGEIGRRSLKNIKIYLPPLPEQRAIASVLTKVDDAIAATKNTIAKAERLKKALMQNLLTGRLKPDGTRRTDDEFYIDEKFGKVPKGWEVKKLRNITSGIVMGQSPSSASYNSENIGLPYVQGNTDMGEKYPKIRVFTSDPKKISNKNDILISVRAPVGELFINNLERIAIGRGFGAIRFEDQILASYFFQFFKHDRKQFIRLEQGTTFTEIGQREVKNLLLPVPPQNDTESICEKLLEIDELIEKKKLKIQKLERLKKALMQNLLTGKKRLKADYIQGFANG